MSNTAATKETQNTEPSYGFIKGILLDTKNFTVQKAQELVEGSKRVVFDSLSIDSLEQKGFPLSASMLGSETDKSTHINMGLYMLLQYLENEHESFKIDELFSNDTFKNFNYTNTKDGIVYTLDSSAQDNSLMHQNILIPQEWIIRFFGRIGNIHGREYFFEHFIDKHFNAFKSFDGIGYTEHKLDEIIGEFFTQGSNYTIEAFSEINKWASSLQEKRFVFGLTHTLLPGDIKEILNKSLEILNKMQIYYQTETLGRITLNRIKENILLLKIQGEELTTANLLKNEHLYTFIPNIFLAKGFGEDHIMVGILHSAGKKYRPAVVNDLDLMKFKAKNTKGNIDLGIKKAEEYSKEHIDFVKKKLEKYWGETLSIMEVEQIITWYEQNLSSLVNNYKEDLKIGLDLLPEQLQESVMNHRLQSNKDNHPNGLAHISLSDYSNLYQKYYSFKALYKEVQLRFEFSNDEIQLAETFPLWNKIKQIIEKKSKSKIVALPLRYKLLKSWLGFLGKVGVKKSVIYTIPSYLGLNLLKEEFLQTDIFKKFNGGTEATIGFSAELNNFLQENITLIKDISFGLDLLKEGKALNDRIKTLEAEALSLKTSITKQGSPDYMSNLDAIPFEEQYDDDELKEDLSKLDTLQDEITQLEEMEAETKELYKAFNLGAEKINFLGTFHDLLHKEHVRAYSSYEKIS